MKKIILATCMTVASFCASASTLTGDEVTITTTPSVFTMPLTVGAGTDLSVGSGSGTFLFDLNRGPDGNRFTLTSVGSSTFSGSNSFTFSDLDFTDGSLLTGFNLLATSLSGFSFSTTADSITFSYSNAFAADGVVIDGTFVTSAAVPLPGTLPLVLLGLGALGIGGRARRSGSSI
jgi:hypothetical protein